MKGQFDWEIGELDENGDELARDTQSWWLFDSVWFLVAAVVITGLLLTGWRVGQAQLARSEEKLRQQVQDVLDLEFQAYESGDGELFFSLLADDPAWRSAQLQPANQEFHRAGPQATKAESHDDTVWASVSWSDDEQVWQRVAFFAWDGKRLVHAASDPAYWGERQRLVGQWGELAYHEVDAGFSAEIAAFVDRLVAEICEAGCLPGRRPFRLELNPHYGETAVLNQINMPSPRLLALTANGKPAPIFWQELRAKIERQLTPVLIRFAVPAERDRVLFYLKAASEFAAVRPDIQVQIVPLDDMAQKLLTADGLYDGAAMAPTTEMVTAGLAKDLTAYAESDPDFAPEDFYEQIWQGAQWQERMWFMPQAAQMKVLFYDKQAYSEAGREEPILRWTWDEMSRDVEVLVAAQPQDSYLTSGFTDLGNDALLSYAYNWGNPCQEPAANRCQRALTPEGIAAALSWYQQLAAVPYAFAEIEALSPQQRSFALMRWQSSRRQVAIWVDDPVKYEHYVQLSPTGVVPFPGSDRFDGITPLWVQGSFIVEGGQQPEAMWQWLKFLSYQRPGLRLIPARPSVAEESGYWSFLPRPVGNAMRTAFPFARAVSLAEQRIMRWDQVVGMISGKTSAEEASQPERIRWFAQDNQ